LHYRRRKGELVKVSRSNPTKSGLSSSSISMRLPTKPKYNPNDERMAGSVEGDRQPNDRVGRSTAGRFARAATGFGTS
jgi:hypothetical protein